MTGGRLVALSVVLTLLALTPVPAQAGDANPDPRAVTLPSFTESPGCDGPYGASGPYATHSGYLEPEEPVPGPWGDFFGRTMEEVHSHMVSVELPMADRPFTLYVHERVVPALEQVIANLEREAAAGRRYTIRVNYTWSYNPITIPGSRRFSFHTVGAAIDINSDTNPYRTDNVLVTDMPAWFVEAWTDAGWCWGGDWQEVKDPMHFSWRGPLHALGYDVPPPHAPLTAGSAFARSVSFDTALEEAPAGSIHLVADLDRDGAPDAVRLREWTPSGHIGVEAAVTQHDYETCLSHGITGRVPRAGAGYALADWTGDGRPDLWAFDASGESLRVEVYRWATGFRSRTVVTPAVPTAGAVAYLPGDYDRDGRTDLFVVRSGSPAAVEVWSGPGFDRRLAAATLGRSISTGDRLALGDYDVDGIPDVYVLSAGASAALQVALGGDAFEITSPVQTAVGTHAGSTLQVADYDGDGREDLIFFEASGRVTLYLGGQRAADADLAGWFSESFDRHWQFGERCVPNPGFETEPGFRGTRLADASGPGAAFAYPNPETGVWTLAALDWSWWHRLPGRLAGLEPIAGPQGPGYAVLAIEQGLSAVEVRDVENGEAYLRVTMAARTDPVDMAVIGDAQQPVAAVAFAGDRPAVVMRDLAGRLVAETSLAGLTPEGLAGVGDVTGDGRADLAVVGRLATGGIWLQTVSAAGGVVTQGRAAGNFAVEGVAALPADGGPGRVAILLRHLGGRRGAVAVLDAGTGERLALFRIARLTSGAIAAASTPQGPVLVVSLRKALNVRVRVEGRDPGSGARLWGAAAPVGFDPADADQIEAGSVLITGHRFGDANVQVAWWNPATGQRVG